MKTRPALIASILASGALLVAMAAGALAATSAPARPASPAKPGSPARPADTLPRLETAAFAGPQHGYGLFTQSAARGLICLAAVGATADGGARFSPVHLAASWKCDDNAPVSAIAADHGGDVFVYGPALRVSHDGGKQWSKASPGGAVLALSAQGRSVWLLTASCPGHGSRPDSCPVQLIVSANGGRTWHPAPVQLAGATLPGFGSQVVGQADLVRTGQRSAYVLTAPAMKRNGKPDSATIWTTGNAGASWARHRVGCGLGAQDAALAVAPGGQIFVACADEPGAGQQDKSLSVSTDGGRTWTTRRPCASKTDFCRPLSLGYLGQIAATSARTVFLVGPRSQLLITANAGRTWHGVRPPIGDEGAGTNLVTFFGTHGIVVGQDGNDNELPAIWHTADGGAHWHVIHPSAS